MSSTDEALQTQLDALFFEELQDNVRILGDGLVLLGHELEDDPRDELVQRLFRAAHSLKGAAHSAGVTDAIGPCHRTEELLDQLRRGSRVVDEPTMEALLADLDLLISLEQEIRAAPGDARSPESPAIDPTRDDPPDDGRVASTPQPTLPGPNAQDDRTRVSVGRLDELVQRTGALLSSADQVRSLTDDVAGVTDIATAIGRHRRRSSGLGSAPGASDFVQVIETLDHLTTRARQVDRQLRHVAAELADAAQDLRLQPFRDVTAGFESTVRELCRSTGTQSRLVIEGGDVELDRDVGDAIREPLLHLVRNAVDHGIEETGTRASRGKAPMGTVRIRAVPRGTQVVVTVADDGAGIDERALRVAAARAGEAPGPPGEDLQLAFVPGVSTAQELTDVSGRGIGLDAAREKVESLGGTIHLRSEPDRGTEVELRVPRTLAVIRVAVVDIGAGVLMTLPTAAIERLHPLGDEELEHVEGRLYASVGGRPRPAVPLADAVAATAGPTGRASAGVAVEIQDEDGLLLVHRADADLDVVLRSLPARVAGDSSVLGAALLPDGRATIVVNPSAALRVGLSTTAAPWQTVPEHPPSRVLLAEDTLTTRALERSILEGAGYDVIVAADGAEALELLRNHPVDVVVSDVDMPRMSGIELCRAIRSSIGLSDVPVILVTSLASADDRRRGLEAGASAYLVKSAFDQAALLDAVRRFV